MTPVSLPRVWSQGIVHYGDLVGDLDLTLSQCLEGKKLQLDIIAHTCNTSYSGG